MGLIRCIDCGAMVSDRAKACPHCGGPIDEQIISRQQQQQLARQQAQPARQQQQQQLARQQAQPARQQQQQQLARQQAQPARQQQQQQLARQQQQPLQNGGGLTKQCPNCHRSIGINLKFCNYCGAKQSTTTAAAAGSASQPQQQSSASSESTVAHSVKKASSQPATGGNDSGQHIERGKSLKLIMTVGASVMAVLLAFFALRNCNVNSSQSAQSEVEQTADADAADLAYMKQSDTWGLTRIKSSKWQELFSSIMNGEVGKFMNLAAEYNNLPENKRNDHITNIYNLLNQNSQLQDQAASVFQNAASGNSIDLAAIDSRLKELAGGGNSPANSPKNASTSKSKSSSSEKSNSKSHHSHHHSSKENAYAIEQPKQTTAKPAGGGAAKPAGGGAAKPAGGGAAKPAGGGAAKPAGGGAAKPGGPNAGNSNGGNKKR